MKRPNFFIIGAPKCGTTALYSYLAEHPQIYMPKVKEPHYFADDFPVLQVVDEERHYLSLFEHAGPDHIAVGEASVIYLYSSVAIQRVREFAPDARIIVMLRNPVDLVYSHHSQLRYGFHEPEKDFMRAWDLQQARRQGQHLPSRPTDLAMLQYKALGQLGHQVKKLLQIFPPEQVKLILFDDFKKSPQSVYEDVLEFLSVPSDNRQDFPRVNENKEYRSPALARVTVALQSLQRKAKRMLGLQWTAQKTLLSHFNVLALLRKINSRKTARSSLTEADRQRLASEFESDIKLLSNIINRDLSAWMNKHPT